MNPERIILVARRLDKALSNHGYLVHRMSEFVLPKTCSNPRPVGDHLRYMLAEVMDFAQSGESLRAVRWLRFVEGGLWTIGVKTIEEIQEIHREVIEETS